MLQSQTTASWIDSAYQQSKDKILRLAATVQSDPLHMTEGGKYDAVPAWFWTSGFWPGLLRLVLDDQADADLERFARECEDRIWATISNEDFFELHHDTGFQFLPTSVLRYHQTGDHQGRQRGVVAAHLLAGRFNIVSQVIEAWNTDQARGFAIIDALMNLPLLYWATETTGEPRFKHVARAHIETFLEHFLREDGSCCHIVAFDQVTGECRGPRAGQGASPSSAWSRGQAWGLYGLALAARAFGEERYAQAANRIADKFIEMNQSHGVPPWDFRANDAATAPRDSSAAAIAACGLIELHALGRTNGRAEAETLLQALTERCATFGQPDEDGLLLHATSNLPVDFGIDVSLVYGDYYYFEALRRLQGRRAKCW